MTLPTQEDYDWIMAARGRAVLLQWEGMFLGLLTFFVLPSTDFSSVYPRSPRWSTPEDVPDGPVIYIDQLGSLVWRRSLARQVEAVITERVPSWRIAFWHRPARAGQRSDRLYTYRRRWVSHG